VGKSQKPTPETVSDNELLERHLAGEPDAFAALVNRYRRELFSFLARFTGSAALAEDVFQEAFLQLHISAGAFDLSRRLKPWLYTIAANKARDALRSRSRHQTAPLDAQMSTADESRTYADLIPSNIPAPDESILNLEARQAVQSIVRDMPDDLRNVVILCYFQELPYKDVAEVLELPLGTVKSRLHTAVKHFAKKWKSQAERLGHERQK